MKRKISVALLTMALSAGTVLTACGTPQDSTSQAPTQETEAQDQNIKTYESKDGWKLSYNPQEFSLNDTLPNGEISFNYLEATAGTTAVSISYYPGKMPDEVLYEKVKDFDDSLVTRGEEMFRGYWSHYRSIEPQNQDPNAGDVVKERFTAIEHNGGTVLIDYISHPETDAAKNDKMTKAIEGLCDTFELLNHEPQKEYAHIPGKYVRKYKEEIEGQEISVEDSVELKDDHTCILSFQDTIEGVWTGTKLITYDKYEEEYKVEGDTLYLNTNGEWLPFEKI